MSVYRPKGTSIYVMDFWFHGKRFRESTLLRDYDAAVAHCEQRKQQLREGIASVRTSILHGENTLTHHLRSLIPTKRVPTSPHRMNADMEFIVRQLNGAVGAKHLRDLVSKWKASGPSTERLFHKYPSLLEQLNLVFRPSLGGMQSGNATFTLGGGLIEEGSAGEAADNVRHFTAMRTFLMLLFNPGWKQLRGPCPKCDSYFLAPRADWAKNRIRCPECKHALKQPVS